MKNAFEKLFVRSTDYVAAIDVEDDNLLENVFSTAKGMICAGRTGKNNFDGLKNVKIVKSPKHIDEGVFNKVLVCYSEEVNLKTLVKIVDNLGLVLICGVPNDRKNIFENLLAKKAGIYEIWNLESDNKDCVDFLFKVRKY